MARTLVVGFDGATLDLCERWIGDGRMPALEGLWKDGVGGLLRSTLPSNSAVAWTSLATGMGPGHHGIFDFVLPRRGGYGYRVATREDRRTAALWNHAAGARARVGVVNIPMTFPAEAVTGVMVSGMDAPQLDGRAVHPAGYLAELRRVAPGYRIMSNAHHAAALGDFDRAERELVDVMVARARFTAELARPRDLDLLMVNLEATDGAHHFFWQHHDPTHPRHDPAAAARWGDAIGRVYQASDAELGRLIDAFDPETVFVVSDHGGGPTSDWVLHMNDWLAAEGLLRVIPSRRASMGRRLYAGAKERLPVPVRRRLRFLSNVLDPAKSAAMYGDVDWSTSRAYAHVQPAVRLNLAGREARGIVTEADRARVAEEIAERARALRLPSGEPAFPEVHAAAEAYPGTATGGPDLVMEAAPGLHIRSRGAAAGSAAIARVSDLGAYFPSGVHTRMGLVVAAGRGIERAERAEPAETFDIRQVAPSVLAVMGVPAPPLELEPFAFVSAAPVHGAAADAQGPSEPTDLDAAEEEEVLERLRGLGYVD